jgi:hypothetical protein
MKVFAGALLVACSLTLAASAGASCNAIPSAEMLSLGDPPRTPPGSGGMDPGLEHFGFKGALGRIDRVHLLPGATKSIVLVPDDLCVDPASRRDRAAPRALEPIDDLVTVIVFKTAEGEHFLRAYASTEVCEELGRRSRAAIHVLPTCTNDVAVIPVGTSSQGLRVPLPSPSELDAALKTKRTLPSVRIVVARRQKSPDALAALVERAATRPCRETCGKLLKESGLVCVDDIFARGIGADGQPTYSSDPIPCTVQKPEGFPRNDYAKMCEDDVPFPDLPPCKPATPLPALVMWEDECGGVHVPFDWRDIHGGGTVKRLVRGRTGVGRHKPTDDPPIWVPGREFLGSTPFNDPEGTKPGVDWRKPDIDVSDEAKEEFGLKGAVDRDDSIVHVFPQLPTDLVCKGGTNACMRIVSQTARSFRDCACKDSEASDCTCDPPLGKPRLFICGSGTFRGMPCTRDQHCKPDGRCNAKPHCQKPDAVWLTAAKTPDDKGTECTEKAECEAEPVNTQCGYRLFNLRDAVVLDATVEPGGGRKRRGGCKPGGQACSNGGGHSPCPSGVCRGYVLWPRGKKN